MRATQTKLHTRGRTTPVQHSRDTSASGRDANLALRFVREGATDEAIEKVLARGAARKSNASDYIARTINFARSLYEKNISHAKIVRVACEHLPPREDGRAALTRLRLTLRTDDGELIETDLVVPLHGRENAWKIYEAVLPDMAPGVWCSPAESRVALKRVVGRRVEVALRQRRVVWMRAVEAG